MPDAAAAPPVMQRVRGQARVALSAADGITRLSQLHQSGSAKAFLPRTHAGPPQVVLLNTAGGMTGGDRLEYAISLGPGASASVATQTAERAYRAGGGVARMTTRLTLAAGSELHWLPQELILFEAAAAERRLEVEMTACARLVFAESVILGRQAMGEVLALARLVDRRIIRRDGTAMMVDAQAISPGQLAMAAAPAGLAGARALATVGLVAADATARLDGMRAVLAPLAGRNVAAAASAWDGRLIARFMAPDGRALRHAMTTAVAYLTGGVLPRVWQI